MNNLKYFTAIGNQYTMKRDYVFLVMVCLALLGLTILGVRIKEPIVSWFFGIMAVVCFISIWSKLVLIDMDEKEFVVKVGLIGKRIEIPFEDFQSFKLVRMKQYFITTNTYLIICYLKDGKQKEAAIAQGMTSKSMQKIANEIDEILLSNEHS